MRPPSQVAGASTSARTPSRACRRQTHGTAARHPDDTTTTAPPQRPRPTGEAIDDPGIPPGQDKEEP